MVVGALVALTVLMSTTQNNEQGKIDAIANKSCQDMTEVLMSMPYADLTNLKNWSTVNNQPLTFDVTASGFPRQSGGGFVKGAYSLTDVSDQFGYAANSKLIWKVTVRIDYQKTRTAIVTRRKDPNYQ